MQLPDLIKNNPKISSISENFNKAGNQLLFGVGNEAKAPLMAQFAQTKRPMILVVKDNFSVNRYENELAVFLPKDKIHTFSQDDYLSIQQSLSSPNVTAAQVDTLKFLSSGASGLAIVSASAVKTALMAPSKFKKATLKLKTGQSVDLIKIREQLAKMHYKLEPMVQTPGDFAYRGDIIDVFPLDASNPYRIEFFGDEVDIIKEFDATTQKSIDNVEEISIGPNGIYVTEKDDFAGAKRAINETDDSDEDKFAISEFIDQVEETNDPNQISLIAPRLFSGSFNIFDYAKNAIVMVDEFSDISEHLVEVERENEAFIDTSSLAKIKSFINNSDLLTELKSFNGPKLFLNRLNRGLGKVKFDNKVSLTVRNVPLFFNQVEVLKNTIQKAANMHQTVVITMDNEVHLKGMQQILNDYEIKANIVKPNELEAGATQVTELPLVGGFEIPEEKLLVITQREVFNIQQHKRRTAKKIDNAERIKKYSDLKVGDYVVHVNHGIGRYTGITTMKSRGITQDFISLEFADHGEIFVPIDQLNLVQKYVASDSKKPRMNKLGGTSWQKTKRKVQARINDMADDLLDLYAKRNAQKGYKFGPDDEMQHAFEQEFSYQETPDQLRATREIKQDMESDKPMDRLLVGDVGFGKTEVAMRAAFKAVENGKQVAVLVPTTVLAQQHFETFTKRFEDFPVDVEMISRFRTKEEIKQTLANLKSGKTNIVIGTHRILSKDIKFDDLGLLIVDEEQRFGVGAKEKIKQLKDNVDVLTLTATPIPRTLNMSMIGARDLSVLETPPANRYPIQTYVMEQNWSAIHQAINREVKRNGQVFYLHNRVSDISSVAAQIEGMNPDVTVAFAHGQMPQNQLEDIMHEFSEGNIDVLVTTTIIETGVDLPNVNTMIVEEAENYGLSQLYQLRGRIGRSARVAFAYFMYRPNKVLTEAGQKRLKAIKDFTELGSGFKIAMQDLSIRGAGDILGREQHGFIDSVGFDMYSKMLKGAVDQKQGKPAVQNELQHPRINLEIETYLPEDYIEDHTQKIDIYQRISQVEELDDLDDIQDELLDRYGEYPAVVGNLLEVVKIRIMAEKLNISEIITQNKGLIVKMNSNADKLTGKDLMSALENTQFRATISDDDESLSIKLTSNSSNKEQVDDLLTYLTELLKIKAKVGENIESEHV